MDYILWNEVAYFFDMPTPFKKSHKILCDFSVFASFIFAMTIDLAI